MENSQQKLSEDLYYQFRNLWTEKHYSKNPESVTLMDQRYGQAFLNFCAKHGVSIQDSILYCEKDDGKAHSMIYDYVAWSVETSMPTEPASIYGE